MRDLGLTEPIRAVGGFLHGRAPARPRDNLIAFGDTWNGEEIDTPIVSCAKPQNLATGLPIRHLEAVS